MPLGVCQDIWGHWQRFYHTLIYPQFNSVLAWEVWFYMGYIVLLLAELWLLMRCDLARWSSEARGWRGGVYRLLSLGFRCPTTDAEIRPKSEPAMPRRGTGC